MGKPYTIGGRTFDVPPATLADQGEILRIQREAMKQAEAEGPFSAAHIDSAMSIVLVLLKVEGLSAADLLPLFPARSERWQAEIRRLYVAADLIDGDAPGEASSP